MKKLSLMVILALILFVSGCKKTEYVYVSMTLPPDAKGVLMIVDNRKIKVFNPETKTHSKIRLKGFYPIYKVDLQAFVDALKEKKAREKKKENE